VLRERLGAAASADRRTPTRVLSYSRIFSRSFVQAASFRTAMTSLRGLITREINEISRLKSVAELRGFDTVSWFHFGRKVRQPGRFSASTRSSAMQPGVERAHNRGVLQQCEASKAPSVTIIGQGLTHCEPHPISRCRPQRYSAQTHGCFHVPYVEVSIRAPNGLRLRT